MLTRSARVVALIVSMLVLVAAGLTGGQTAGTRDGSTGEVDGAGVPGGQPIRFSFKDASFDEVLDFMARQTDLPVIREAAVPKAPVTFISAASYSLEDALDILNRLLWMHGVQVRREPNFLLLSKIEDMRALGPVVENAVPGAVGAADVVTIVVPLENASASPTADQLKPLVSKFGAVSPLPQQNLLVIVDTAAQCRRLRSIIEIMDAEPPSDSKFQLFPLVHAQAETVVQALRGLVGEKQTTIIIDKDGKKRKVEEQNIAGLSLQPDKRTNSVIAVGPEARIRQVEQLIALLDRPDGSGANGREMMTFRLSSMSAGQAQREVSKLFQGMPANRRPVFVPIESQGALAMVGSAEHVMQASALLSAVDPGSGPIAERHDDRLPPASAAIIGLTHLEPREAIAIVERLLSARQRSVLRYTPTPAGRGIALSGPVSDIEMFRELVRTIDVPARLATEVRQLTLKGEDPAGVIARAEELYALDSRSSEAPVQVTFDERSRTATLVGSREALGVFSQLLTSVERTAVVEQEVRTIELSNTDPSELIRRLQRLASSMLQPVDGRDFVAPSFEALPELDAVLVRAHPDQLPVIERLVSTLDEPTPTDNFRVVRVNTDPQGLADRANAMFLQQSDGMSPAEAGRVSVEVDRVGGNLLITGDTVGVRRFTAILSQVQQLLPPDRTTSLIDMKQASAGDIVAPLERLVSTLVEDPSRDVAPPTIRVIEATNSLLVTAERAQHDIIRQFAQRLDRIEPAQLPPLKLLQIRTADAVSVARMLAEQYSKRPASERAERPVDISSDAATNTMIVAAHADVFDEIRSFVDDLNQTDRDAPERVTELFPLRLARASDVASAMERLYPPPPVPVDRRGRPMPWLQKPREVLVSADPASNALIIEAPAERMEAFKALAEKLDRVELPPQADLRTYHIVNADIQAIATTLRALAQRGNLSGPAEPGRPSVEVVIEVEPQSSTLIVAGDTVTFGRVEDMLDDLSAMPIERGLRIVPITNARAADIREQAVAIYESRVAAIPDATPIDVTIDDASNSLMVVADGEAMGRFIDIIEQLQRRSGPAREVRLIELRYAKAGEVAAFLSDLHESSRPLSETGGPDPIWEPIEATNALLVGAQPAQFPVIESLIRSLDSRRSAERQPMRILRLRTTDASNLAQVLTRSYNQRSPDERAKLPVEISSDASTNTLIVSAHPDVYGEIEEIVTSLNQTQSLDAEGREIRIFPLKVARAEALARTIDQMYPQPPVPRDSRGRPRPDLQQPREVVVRADPATNSLIVDAPVQRLAGFEALVRQLDQQQVPEDLEVRTYRVKRAELGAVTRTLQELVASKVMAGPGGRSSVAITSEPVSRTLVVSGPTEMFADVERILSELDAPSDQPATGLKMYPLEHARAERLQPLIDRLLKQRLNEQQEREGETPNPALLEVASDGPTNTLIVSAPEPIQQIAGELIESLDLPAAEAGRRVLRVVPMTFADAAQAAATINAALPTMELPSGGSAGSVSVLATSGSNALLLSGADEDLDKVAALVEQLDVRPFSEEAMDVATVELEHADAQAIARTVERLIVDQQRSDPRMLQLRYRYQRNRGPELPPARVESEPRTNSLIVSGPVATVELAKKIIERLDVPADRDRRGASVFTPTTGDPSKLAASVLRVMSSSSVNTPQPVQIDADAQTGSVIVVGSQEQVGEALRLLADFDERAIAPPEVTIRVFQLEQTSAEVAEGAVRSMLSDRARWPDALQKAVAAGVSVPAPTVNADRAGNRIIVSAPASLVAMVDGFIGVLDKPAPAGSSEVRVFTLQRADAAGVQEALSRTLSADAKPGAPAPVVVAEPTSNAVMVTATPEQIRLAASVLEELDGAARPDGMGVRTVRLQHADAEALAPVVESLVARESLYEGMAPWDRAWMMRRFGVEDQGEQVRVVAERRLNAIVLTGPAGGVEIAEQIVKELDVAPAGDGPASTRAVRILTLRNADASEVAASIEAVLEDEQGAVAPAVVRVDAGSNSLIVRGTDAQLSMVADLVATLDEATVSASRELRRITIDPSKADAQEIAETIRRLMGRSGGATVEVISAEELFGDSADEDRRGSDAGGRAVPRGIPAALVSLVVAVQSPADADDEPADVTIAVDPASNTLVLIGSARGTERVVELARQLEAEMPAEASTLRVIQLPSGIDVNGVGNLVSQTVRQIGRRSDGNPGGFTGRPLVLTDRQGGGLVVVANDTDFSTIRDLIRAVGQPTRVERVTVKVYPLKNINARRAERSVRDLVGGDPRGRQAKRVLELTLQTAEGETARIEPGSVNVTSDPAGASLIVTGPVDSLPVIDRFVELIDQAPVTDRITIRRFGLENGQATQVVRTLQGAFDATRQGPGSSDIPRARFVGDDRTNTILATGTSNQLAEVERLLGSLDAPQDEGDAETALITLKAARPSAVRQVIETILVGRDTAKRERIRVAANDNSKLLAVTAAPEEIARVREIVEQMDQAETTGLPIRSIKLERADASVVARALRQFFRDRASGVGSRGRSSVSIVGDRQTSTLVVSASDEDFAQVQSIAATFDEPAPSQDLQLKVIPLEHARVNDVRATIERMIDEVRFPSFFWWDSASSPPDTLVVDFSELSNSVIVMGQGESFGIVERIVDALDQPRDAESDMTAKAVKLERADPRTVGRAIEEALSTPGWPWWRGNDPDGVNVEVDTRSGMLIVMGRSDRVEQALAYAAELDSVAAGEVARSIETIEIKFASAVRVASSLRRFFDERARRAGTGNRDASFIGSDDGNVLIVSASEADMEVVGELVAQMDRPDEGDGRVRELYQLKNAEANELAQTLRAQFPRRRGSRESGVLVTTIPTSNTLIVSAPEEMFESVAMLIEQLDAPPSDEDARIVTVTLESARAEDIASSLTRALPSTVNVEITPVPRINAVMLTGSDEAIALAVEQINKLDEQPVRSPIEFRRIALENAIAYDVYDTLVSLLRGMPRDGETRPTVSYARTENAILVQGTAEQLESIGQIVSELDQPTSDDRRMEFVTLRFSDAEQTAKALDVFYGPFASIPTTPEAERVAIIPIPISNSLLISADEREWARIQELLKELDSEEYDTSRQLEIISLEYADASSLARAMNEAFQAPLRAELERERARRDDERRNNRRRDEFDAPAVLIDTDETVTVTAEPLTNSLIVSANKEDLARIRTVVEQVDVPGFAEMPDARIIPVKNGLPSQLATSLRQLYESTGNGRGPRAVVIVGHDRSRTLIVRADDAEFARIRALAETLQQETDSAVASVRVLKLHTVPAARLATTIRSSFGATASYRREPLGVEADRTSNSLVISSSEAMFEEIREVVRELDGAGLVPDGMPDGDVPPSGVYLIDLKHLDPERMQALLVQIGVTRPVRAEEMGLVGEPVRIIPLRARKGLAIVAASRDAETVMRLVKSLDTAGIIDEQLVAVIALKTASADGVARALRVMVTPSEGSVDPATAGLAEQIRRVAVHNDRAGRANTTLDLSVPIRIVPDGPTNSLIIASTRENVEALRDVIGQIDRLPLGDAVVLRFFPLEHGSAERISSVIQDIFRQGERIRRRPGTTVSGEPTTEVGRALIGEIAVAVDQRTNALIVAGREEAVALVEVMVGQLDDDRTANWIEPVIIPVEHADPARLADRLRQVLVEGIASTPEAEALQRQIARIRVGDAGDEFETGLFAPMSSLVIIPEEQLRALLVLGSDANVAAVTRLVEMLDLPAAAAANAVRIYPLRFAAAERVGNMLEEVFRQQVRIGAIRSEDDVIVVSDPRTNALVVSTSPGSFEVVESLIARLDGDQADPLVGVHVIRVPNTDVDGLARSIERIMRDRIEAGMRGGPSTPRDTFTIQADRASESLIIACSEENLEIVRGLIDTLAEGGAPVLSGQVVDLIPTGSVRADEMADAIDELYVEPETAKRGRDAVKVQPDPRLKALIVRGTQADVDAIRELVERLEVSPTTAVTEIKRIELTKANAADVLQLLEDILAGRPLAGGRSIGSRQAQILRFMKASQGRELEREGIEPTEAEISGAIQEQVTLTAELRTNSIVVVAPSPVMLLIEEIVADLDTTSAGARQVEIFRLENADARAMAEVLRDLFNLRQQGNTLVLVPGRGRETGDDPVPEVDTQLFPIPDERQQLSITIDARTNTLLVSATDEYLSEVRKVVMELDAIEANEREQLVYELRNARASEVAETLRGYFDSESDTFREILGPDRSGSLIRLLEREVTVQGDEASQRLIVGVSPKYKETIDQIVAELDATPPQVMIQVLLAEVTLDDTTEWGVDFRGGPAGSRGVVGTFLTAGVGAATALGVPNLAVTSADFELLIRALEAQGKLEVLSRPQILVNNNEPARIQVGENIALVENVTRFEDSGNTSADVSRRDVGIIMNVTPSINADGFVRMEIFPEISTVSAQTTQISEDFVAPIINQRQIETNVTVMNGETIVIGGLIQRTRTQRDTKVPVLGDIPVVGELFQSHDYSNTKTELLVILTPRVIRSGSEAGVDALSDLTVDEIDTLSVPESVRRMLKRNRIERDGNDPQGLQDKFPADAIREDEIEQP